MNKFQRGIAIEEHLAATEYSDWWNVGATRGGTSELVDFQRGDVVVSLKSANTNGRGWVYELRTHIDNLSTWGVQVNGRPAVVILDLRVQPGGTAAAAASGLVTHRPNVVVRITEFP